MNKNYIIADPKIMTGKSIIIGTRITVEFILGKMARGETVEDILKAHPRLTKETVLASVDYMVKVLKSDIVEIQIA